MGRSTYRKVITSPELIESINKKNKKLIDKFLKNFNTRRSDASVKVYASNFNIFFCWNVENNDNKFFCDIKKSQFIEFFDYAVEELKWSPNRYAQMWSSLNSLSNFIENILDDEYPDFRNQVKKIEKLPKANIRKKTILTEEQINLLFEHLIEKEEYQQAALLALACYSGARISELFRFTTDLINEENVAFDGFFLETTDEIKTKGRGKTGKMLYKYILKAPFLPHYNKWIEEREKILKENNQSHNSLFIKKNGAPADISDGRRWMKSWEKFLTKNNENGEDVHLYAHCIRHYLCTYLSKIGIEQELIVELFGWGSDAMYHIYNDLTAKDKKFKSLEKLKNIK